MTFVVDSLGLFFYRDKTDGNNDGQLLLCKNATHDDQKYIEIRIKKVQRSGSLSLEIFSSLFILCVVVVHLYKLAER